MISNEIGNSIYLRLHPPYGTHFFQFLFLLRKKFSLCNSTLSNKQKISRIFWRKNEILDFYKNVMSTIRNQYYNFGFSQKPSFKNTKDTLIFKILFGCG